MDRENLLKKEENGKTRKKNRKRINTQHNTYMKNRKSPRKKGYDYTLPGAYFITICTKNMQHFFGTIQNQTLIHNELGKYTTHHRSQISDHYPFVIPDEFICMPNHIHGIIIIQSSPNGRNFLRPHNLSTKNFLPPHHLTPPHNVSSPQNISNAKVGIQPKSGSLGAIIRGFKIGITKYAKQNNIQFKRHGRYHDSIIKNKDSYQRIKQYIRNNPKNRKH